MSTPRHTIESNRLEFHSASQAHAQTLPHSFSASLTETPSVERRAEMAAEQLNAAQVNSESVVIGGKHNTGPAAGGGNGGCGACDGCKAKTTFKENGLDLDSNGRREEKNLDQLMRDLGPQPGIGTDQLSHQDPNAFLAGLSNLLGSGGSTGSEIGSLLTQSNRELAATPASKQDTKAESARAVREEVSHRQSVSTVVEKPAARGTAAERSALSTVQRSESSKVPTEPREVSKVRARATSSASNSVTQLRNRSDAESRYNKSASKPSTSPALSKLTPSVSETRSVQQRAAQIGKDSVVRHSASIARVLQSHPAPSITRDVTREARSGLVRSPESKIFPLRMNVPYLVRIATALQRVTKETAQAVRRPLAVVRSHAVIAKAASTRTAVQRLIARLNGPVTRGESKAVRFVIQKLQALQREPRMSRSMRLLLEGYIQQLKGLRQALKIARSQPHLYREVRATLVQTLKRIARLMARIERLGTHGVPRIRCGERVRVRSAAQRMATEPKSIRSARTSGVVRKALGDFKRAIERTGALGLRNVVRMKLRLMTRTQKRDASPRFVFDLFAQRGIRPKIRLRASTQPMRSGHGLISRKKKRGHFLAEDEAAVIDSVLQATAAIPSTAEMNDRAAKSLQSGIREERVARQTEKLFLVASTDGPRTFLATELIKEDDTAGVVPPRGESHRPQLQL